MSDPVGQYTKTSRELLDAWKQDMQREQDLRDRISELESARKDWTQQKWLLEMELEGYKELCKAQEFIINELKVAE